MFYECLNQRGWVYQGAGCWTWLDQFSDGPVLTMLDGGQGDEDVRVAIKCGRYRTVDVLPCGHCWIENEFDEGWDVENQFSDTLVGLIEALEWVEGVVGAD